MTAPATDPSRLPRGHDPRGRMHTPGRHSAGCSAADSRPTTNGDHPVKFRVDRDVLADAVAWAARSLPVRPSVPVLAGLLIEAERRRAGPLHLRLRDLGPGHAHRRRSPTRAGPWSAAGCSPTSAAACPAKPVEMVLDGTAGLADLRLGAVQPADDAGRGLPEPARHAGRDRHRQQRRVRARRRPGRHRRRPRRHAAGADRRPDRDRRLDDLAAGHRPVPALAPRARAGARAPPTSRWPRWSRPGCSATPPSR